MPRGLETLVERLHERARTQCGADHAQADSGQREPEHDPPPAGGEPAVGKEQQGKGEQPKARRKAELLKQRSGPAAGQRVGRDEEHLLRVLVAEVGHAQGDSGQAEDPADRVLRHARRDHCADGRERQRGGHERQAGRAVERRPVGRGVLAGSEHEQDKRAERRAPRRRPRCRAASRRVSSSPRLRRPQPQRHVGGCIVSADDGAQLGAERAQVDLVAQRAPRTPRACAAASYLRR